MSQVPSGARIHTMTMCLDQRTRYNILPFLFPPHLPAFLLFVAGMNTFDLAEFSTFCLYPRLVFNLLVVWGPNDSGGPHLFVLR